MKDESDDLELGAPAAASYKSHSGGILDVLEDVNTKIITTMTIITISTTITMMMIMIMIMILDVLEDSRGSHSSNTTCLTHVFFKSGE